MALKTKTLEAKLEAKKITFKVEAPGAKEVMLAGDFNNWKYNTTPLRRTKGAEWTRELTLQPGRYEYKFVVDGKWVTDPSNSNKSRNSFGTENSVLIV